MIKVDYRKQIGNFAYWRNVANEGRGSQMTQCLHEACDYAVKLETDRAELVEALELVLAIMCDKEICGHFLPREIREVIEPLLARLEADE